MEKIVEELKTLIKFKDTLEVGDIALVLLEENNNAVYARITSVTRDETRKDEWWHVGLAFLSLPIQNSTWTLRTEQMTGREIFTMSEKKRFFKAVSFEDTPQKTKLQHKSKPKASTLKRIK